MSKSNPYLIQGAPHMKLIRDTAIVAMRELRLTIRDPFSLIFTLVQPIVFLAFFGPLLTGIPGVGDVSPWQWFVPGNLVMIGLFGTSMSGSNLLYEMQTGSHERLLVTPLSRSALLIGRALKEIVPLVVQAILIIIVVLPFGFQLFPLGVVMGLLMLAIFGVGLGALSYALAVSVKNKEWLFYGVQQTLLFPLLILSGTLLPLDAGPDWLKVLARINPLTHIVEAERALFSGDLTHSSVMFGAIAALVIAVAGLTIGTRAMRRAAL
jgi:ABC-2 type transport system permease protein